ncbi:hypothetical protein HHI36_024068 [Cryptolaemus montrouzieri]|uniref:Uncharacterized protein n=1 Tax=Cryptolaemus montrouzieri TaxID=559131 RepID=A0ABD2N0R7_9CUCU
MIEDYSKKGLSVKESEGNTMMRIDNILHFLGRNLRHIKVLKLRTNMRTDPGEQDFSRWLHQLGMGTINETRKDLPKNTVLSPDVCLTQDVSKNIYGNIDVSTLQRVERQKFYPHFPATLYSSPALTVSRQKMKKKLRTLPRNT